MIALIFGIVLIGFAVFSILPGLPLDWGAYVISFLKGFAPVLAAFTGLISILIGTADIKDKCEARKEEIEAAKTQENTNK